MIVAYPRLRQYLRENEVSWSELAAVAGMNSITLHMKMWGILQWTLTEVLRICCFFRCPDAEHLFVRNHSKSQ
jgi:hypothetical protein